MTKGWKEGGACSSAGEWHFEKKNKPSLMMILIIYTRFVDRTRMNCRHKRVSGGSQIKDWIFMVTIIIGDKAKVRNSLYILEFN